MEFEAVLNQTITYWSVASIDVYGKKTFAAPVSIAARWEDKQTQIRTSTGDKILSTANVIVSVDLTIGGWVYQGTSSDSDPTTVTDAHEIAAFKKVPDISGTVHFRQGYMI